MNTYPLTILTPEHSFYEDEAESFVFDSPDGQICVLHNHAPFVSVIEPCIAIIKDRDGNSKKAFLADGFVEITADGDCNVFTQSAEWPDKIDREHAMKSVEKAKKKLAEHKLSDPFMTKFDNLHLLRATERLKAVDEKKGNK